MKIIMPLILSLILVLPVHAETLPKTYLRNYEGFSAIISAGLIKSTKINCVHKDGALFKVETTHSLADPSDYEIRIDYQSITGKKYKITNSDKILNSFSIDTIFTKDWRGDYWPQLKDKKYADLTFLAYGNEISYAMGWTLEEGFHPQIESYNAEKKILNLSGLIRNHFHIIIENDNKDDFYIDTLGSCDLSIQIQ